MIMGFGKKFNPQAYPRRLWTLVGYSRDGKTLFATQMKGDLAVIDADGKFDVATMVAGVDNAFAIGEAQEMRDVPSIQQILNGNMPSAKDVGTIVVDSVTPIIKRVVNAVQASGETRVVDWSSKARVMRELSDVVTAWGTDVLFIYHLDDTVDRKGNDKTTTSISTLELSRLRKFVNATLEVVRDGERRGIRVTWSQAGRSGKVLWDDSGTWANMPEKIEAYMYDDLTTAERKKIAEGTFSSLEGAIAWGFAQGVFRDELHAKNSYTKLREQLVAEFGDDLTAPMMFQSWREKVNAKKETENENV
jgi:hypothetical protein